MRHTNTRHERAHQKAEPKRSETPGAPLAYAPPDSEHQSCSGAICAGRSLGLLLGVLTLMLGDDHSEGAAAAAASPPAAPAPSPAPAAAAAAALTAAARTWLSVFTNVTNRLFGQRRRLLLLSLPAESIDRRCP
jgi:hypothetical protein